MGKAMNKLQSMRSPSFPRFETPRDDRTHLAMKPLSAATGRPLRWNRLRWYKKDFELRAGDDPVGALSFRSMWSYLATATSAEVTWTFKRTGFWRPVITVRAKGSDADIAVFRYKMWEDGGWLEFRDGRKFRITDKRWATRFEILTERDEVLIALRVSAWTERSLEVELRPDAGRLPELSLLLLFVWYLAVLTREDAGGA
jgi:hypothetical protein